MGLGWEVVVRLGVGGVDGSKVHGWCAGEGWVGGGAGERWGGWWGR